MLGTPNEKNWEGLEKMPNFKKINFVDKEKQNLQKKFGEAKIKEIKILEQCLKYGQRPSALKLLSSSFY